MATNLLPFRPTAIRASANPGPRKPESQNNKPTSSKWWTPLFSWPSEADYFESDITGKPDPSSKSDSDVGPIQIRSRGAFTEEKARKLRMMTKDTAFHDVMYHSAIASRLAFAYTDRSDP